MFKCPFLNSVGCVNKAHLATYELKFMITIFLFDWVLNPHTSVIMLVAGLRAVMFVTKKSLYTTNE